MEFLNHYKSKQFTADYFLFKANANSNQNNHTGEAVID